MDNETKNEIMENEKLFSHESGNVSSDNAEMAEDFDERIELSPQDIKAMMWYESGMADEFAADNIEAASDSYINENDVENFYGEEGFEGENLYTMVPDANAEEEIAAGSES